MYGLILKNPRAKSGLSNESVQMSNGVNLDKPHHLSKLHLKKGDMDTKVAQRDLGDSGWHIHTMDKTDNQREPTVQHRGLYPTLHGDLNGKEIQKGGYLYMCGWFSVL